jgi:hypothetical protein
LAISSAATCANAEQKSPIDSRRSRLATSRLQHDRVGWGDQADARAQFYPRWRRLRRQSKKRIDGKSTERRIATWCCRRHFTASRGSRGCVCGSEERTEAAARAARASATTSIAKSREHGHAEQHRYP